MEKMQNDGRVQGFLFRKMLVQRKTVQRREKTVHGLTATCAPRSWMR